MNATPSATVWCKGLVEDPVLPLKACGGRISGLQPTIRSVVQWVTRQCLCCRFHLQWRWKNSFNPDKWRTMCCHCPCTGILIKKPNCKLPVFTTQGGRFPFSMLLHICRCHNSLCLPNMNTALLWLITYKVLHRKVILYWRTCLTHLRYFHEDMW